MPYNYRVKISDWQTRPLQFSQPATFVVVWPVPLLANFDTRNQEPAFASAPSLSSVPLSGPPQNNRLGAHWRTLAMMLTVRTVFWYYGPACAGLKLRRL